MVLTIADDGIGFDVVHHPTASERTHFGLGLLDDMASESGGNMQVRSAPGCGTTIRFELPAK